MQNDRGFVRVQDQDGRIVKGYIQKLDHNWKYNELKLTLEEKGKLQEDLFGVGACWNNSQRVIIEEGTDNSVGYYFIYPNRRITYLQKDHNIFDFTFDRIVDKDTALNLLRYRIFLK